MRHVPTPEGISIAVHEHGGVGRPTLLCHATGFHGAVWEPLSAALGDGFERWAIDFRGHGASVVPAGSELAWRDMADDVLRVVDALEMPHGEIVGVGHSMGGACLLLAEQARPGTFAGLWLFEPIVPPSAAALGGSRDNPLADGALRRRASFPSFAEAVANFAAKRPFSVLRADALHAYVRHGFTPGDDGGVHLACRPEEEAAVYRGSIDHDAFAHLGDVGCPVVVACGDDGGVPAAFAPAIAEALPNGRLERHDHTGHFGPLQAPEAMAAAVRAFASSL